MKDSSSLGWKRTSGALLAAALLVALCCGCGGEAALPSEYSVAGQSVPALLVPEGGSMAETEETTYTYENVTDSAEVAKSYVVQLTGEDNGFLAVDETYTQTDEPDFEADEGSVLLAKAIEDGEGEGTSQAEDAAQQPESELLLVQVDWAAESCVVTTSRVAGSITYPKAESAVVAPPMTEGALLEYIKSLSPVALGLSGTSMDAYRIYTMTGDVYVDGRPCRRVQVYSRDEISETNRFEGLYLISSDRKIYRMDPSTDAIATVSPF